jgi:uncharacterized membrane protein YeiH
MSIELLLVVLDLIGTFVFAVSGAAAGIKHRLDLFGVLVLAFAAATAGGLARDLMIGAIPPAAISDPRYVFVSILAGLAVFWVPGMMRRLHDTVLLFDAGGLALFVISGTVKALSFGLNPVASALLGMLTGIGGGIVRDLLVQEVPTVLRREIYAVAGLVGAVVVVVGRQLQLPAMPVALAAALLCFGLRLMSIRRQWQLPIAMPGPEASATSAQTTSDQMDQ